MLTYFESKSEINKKIVILALKTYNTTASVRNPRSVGSMPLTLGQSQYKVYIALTGVINSVAIVPLRNGLLPNALKQSMIQ